MAAVCVMLCPASCLPLLRELAQWRCLLGWHRQHSVGSSGSAGLSANAGHQQQGSEAKGKAGRPIGHTKPLSSRQVSPGLNAAPLEEEPARELLKTLPLQQRQAEIVLPGCRVGFIWFWQMNFKRCSTPGTVLVHEQQNICGLNHQYVAKMGGRRRLVAPPGGRL